MASIDHLPASFRKLLVELRKLPGVGPKTALRYVFALARLPVSERSTLVQAFAIAAKTATRCARCNAVADQEPCVICKNPKRNQNVLCVVARDEDMITLEDTRTYDGLYYVVGSAINPLEGADTVLRVLQPLADRAQKEKPGEIILAFNPDIEGEATIMYLTRLLATSGARITRLARGLPMGSDLEYADPVTLADALSGRREIASVAMLPRNGI